jgi:hypothetical protein
MGTFTGGHEAAGVWPTTGAPTFSASDWASFIASYYAALHAVDSGLSIGAGFLTIEGSYWNAAIALNLPIVMGLDVYASQDPTQYPGVITSVKARCAAAAASSPSKQCAINESAPQGDVPIAGSCGGGDNCAYYGCGYPLWISSGATAMWARVFTAAMRSIPNMSYISIFTSGPMFGTSDSPNNCTDNSVPGSYYSGLMGALSSTPLSTTFGQIVSGAALSISGQLSVRGEVH